MILDAETAASAVRNLNDYDVGGRQLRVDYAAMDPHVENQRGQRQPVRVCVCMFLSLSIHCSPISIASITSSTPSTSTTTATTTHATTTTTPLTSTATSSYANS